MFVSSRFAFVLAFVGIGCGTTPMQRKPIEDVACTMLEAFSGLQNSSKICATASELAEIVLSVQAAHAAAVDAGTAKASKCQVLPGTSTCATDEELAKAIAKVKAKRDGGV